MRQKAGKENRSDRISRASGSDPRVGALGPPPRVSDVRISRFLAGGGFADVWLGRSPAGHVVVKVVRHHGSARELEALKLYKQLADAPDLGLVPIHHIGRCRDSGRLYYTMPVADPLHGRGLCEDSYEPATLAGAIRLRRTLDPSEAIEVSRDVLTALEKLHSKGLVHGDVKPSNILRYHGRWCLGDTGLMMREDALGSTPPSGTPRYLPPEQRAKDRSADLYAFGKTLYEMLNGDVERFPTPASEHVLRERGRAQYRRLYRAINRACSARPEDRYRSARTMLAALSSGRILSRPSVVVGVLVVLVSVVLGLQWIVQQNPPAGETGSVILVDGGVCLAVRTCPPGRSEYTRYEGESPIEPGASIYIEAEVSPDLRSMLALMTYVGSDRLVEAHAPLERASPVPESLRRFGAQLDDEGNPVGFALPSGPAPFAALLFVSTEPLDRPSLEAVVSRSLDEAGGWPRVRSDSPMRFEGFEALEIRGTQVVPWLPSFVERGDPRMGAGEAYRSSPAERFAATLSSHLHARYASAVRFQGYITEIRVGRGTPSGTDE